MAIPLIEAPLIRDIVVYKGIKWEKIYHFQDIDFTGCTLLSEVRDKDNKSSGLILTPTVTFYTSNPALGKIVVSIAGADSEVHNAQGYWSLVLTDAAGDEFIWMKGKVIFKDFSTEL